MVTWALDMMIHPLQIMVTFPQRGIQALGHGFGKGETRRTERSGPHCWM